RVPAAVRAVLTRPLPQPPPVHAVELAFRRPGRRPRRARKGAGGMRTVLHTESSPGLGGQEVRTLTEARWIAERGWRVLLAGQPGAAFTERARQLGNDGGEAPMRGAVGVSGGARRAGRVAH